MINTKHRDRNNNNIIISDETRTRSIVVLSLRIKTCFSLFDLDDKTYSKMCACDIYMFVRKAY